MCDDKRGIGRSSSSRFKTRNFTRHIDDRTSNHATFNAAKRQEIASLTAQIETKQTQQRDPAVAAVEAESMKNDLKDAERSRAEAKEALANARDLEAEELPAIHETTFLMASQTASTVEVELPNSRLWFASSIYDGQHSNSYILIGDEMVCLTARISAEKMIRSD